MVVLGAVFRVESFSSSLASFLGTCFTVTGAGLAFVSTWVIGAGHFFVSSAATVLPGMSSTSPKNKTMVNFFKDFI